MRRVGSETGARLAADFEKQIRRLTIPKLTPVASRSKHRPFRDDDGIFAYICLPAWRPPPELQNIRQINIYACNC